MKKTPLEEVKERFESKEKLVEALKSLTTPELWLDRLNEEKGLEHVSNAKLLRLHRVLSDVKDRFGSRDKLIESILELKKRTGDDGFKARLEKYPTPRLLDLHQSASKAAKQAAKATAAEKPEASNGAKKPARSKKAQAKAKAAS